MAVERGLAHHRACTLLGISRSGLYYSPKLPEKDAPVINAMKRLSAAYPRFGSRRIRIFLQREGIAIGKERCTRLWAMAGLQQIPKKRQRKRSLARQRLLAPTVKNAVWCYDFVYDACANGQKLKCLTAVDEYTRECLAIDVAGSICSSRVIEVLSRLMCIHGIPGCLRSDNGPEFVSEAQVVIEEWRVYYNNVRPYSSLNYQTPSEFINKLSNNLLTEVSVSI